MAICDDVRAIFIHVPRTGGTSIEKKFDLCASHITIESIKEKFPEEFNSYYKFTFVRNPWSRAVSWFRQISEYYKTFAELMGDLQDTSMQDTSKGRSMLLWFLSPQMNWIKDSNGEMPFDFIGRFERLNEDFKVICGYLGIDDLTLPKERYYGEYDYRSYYNDDLIVQVAEKYAEEIEYFGYEFE